MTRAKLPQASQGAYLELSLSGVYYLESQTKEMAGMRKTWISSWEIGQQKPRKLPFMPLHAHTHPHIFLPPHSSPKKSQHLNVL